MGTIIQTNETEKTSVKPLDRYVFIENVDMEFHTKKVFLRH